MRNNRHTDSCDWWCRRSHWTARNIGLVVLWRWRALLRLRFKLWRAMGVDWP